MSNIWFTSDLHFSHKQEFLWDPRGFKDQWEMNEALIENWNKVVKPEDTVYDLGDMALTDPESALKCLKRLNGTHYWIYGNHDTEKKINYFLDNVSNLYDIGYAWVLKYDKKYSLYLSHYPTLTSNYDDKKFSQHVINLHGHVHSRVNWIQPTNPFMYHVGVDSHNCTPVNLDEILTDIKQRYNEINQLPTMIKPEDTYPYEKNLF